MLQKKMRRRIEDVLGGLTVIKMGHGFKVRRTKGPNRKNVLESPAFENFRSTSHDFLQASRDSKTLRYALRKSIGNITDTTKHLRLNSAIAEIFKTDKKTTWGQRSLCNCDPRRLRGFEFNGRNSLHHTFSARYVADIDRAAGRATVTIPAFSPERNLRVPPGATHYIVHAETAAVNFATQEDLSVTATSLPLDVTAAHTGEIILDMPLNAGNDTLFLAFGIYFVAYEHGVEYKLDNSSYSGLVLAAVDVAPTEPGEISQEPSVAINDVIASTVKNDTLAGEEVVMGEAAAHIATARAAQHAPEMVVAADEYDIDITEFPAAALAENTSPGEWKIRAEKKTDKVIASAPKDNAPEQQEAETVLQVITETDTGPDVWPDVTIKQEKKSRQKERKTSSLSQLGLFGDETSAPAG